MIDKKVIIGVLVGLIGAGVFGYMKKSARLETPAVQTEQVAPSAANLSQEFLQFCLYDQSGELAVFREYLRKYKNADVQAFCQCMQYYVNDGQISTDIMAQCGLRATP